MKIIKDPFVFIFPPFAAGIITAYFFHILLPYSHLVFIAIFLLTLILNRLYFGNNPWNYPYFIYPALFLLGIAALSMHYPQSPPNLDQEYLFRAVVTDNPKTKPNSMQFVVKLQSYKDTNQWIPYETRAVVYVKNDSTTPTLHYGDLILIYGRFNEIENSHNPNEFDYKTFMKNKGIFLTSFVKSEHIEVLDKGYGNIFVSTALKIRQKFIRIYKEYGFKGQEFAVLSALTLGYRDEISRETRQIFANTGAMHILAVSGLHVGIIYMILTSMLGFMNKKKTLFRLKAIIIIFSLWMFAAIAGFSPSVTRSALMFSLFVIGHQVMKATTIYNIAFASAFILLLINPLDIFSVGFQLSYAAVLSIVFFQPYIYELLHFRYLIPDKIWALVSVSVAAQIGTMPIGLYYFHQFPNYFFLTNIVVIPLASLILYTAVALITLSFLPVIAKFMAFVLKLWLKLLFVSVKSIDSLPFATTKNIFITGTQLFLLYAIILGISLWLIYRKYPYLIVGLSGLFLFLVADLFLHYQNTKDQSLTIFNVRRNTAMLIKADTLYLIADDALFAKRQSLQYAVLPYLQAKRITTLPQKEFINDSLTAKDTITNVFAVKQQFFKIGNITFVYLDDDKLTDFAPPQKPFHVNYIILAHNAFWSIDRLLQYFSFDKIIFDSSNKQWKLDKWISSCKARNFGYYNVADSGAISINYINGEEIYYR